jgi:dTDP-4-amino-4,6-dideoxygalactose transaminase
MNQNGEIPFVDLISLHRELEDELVAVFKSALETASFVGGAAVEEFEAEFAVYCDAKYCAGVGSGTDALRFALAAAGVLPNDIVLTSPLTFIATTEAISQVGALPDFVDIEARTYTMDPEQLRKYLENKCSFDHGTGRCIHKTLGKAVTCVVPVHLYGQTADMDQFLELAAKYNLTVIEDACQAHGAEYFSKKENRHRKAGSMGHAAAFSFYPGKNLGACGEAGAVTTNDVRIANKVRVLRDHGQSKKYYHGVEGYNGRLDAIQAGILRLKLRHLDRWNERRRMCARYYNQLLALMSGSIIIPYQASWSKPVYHLYVIRAVNRDELQRYLTTEGIGTGIHYPIPIHLQAAYASRGWTRGDFPVAESAADQILSLPMYGGLRAEQQKRVVETIAQFAASCVAR